MSTKICRWCGKEFESDNHPECYCSAECKKLSLKERKAEWAKKNRARKKALKEKNATELICVNCGKKFITTDNRRKYCTIECKTKWSNAKAMKKYYEQKAEQAGSQKHGPWPFKNRNDYARINQKRKNDREAAQEWLKIYRQASEDLCADMIADACGIDRTEWRRLPLTIKLKKRAAVLEIKQSLARQKGIVYDN